MAFVPFTEEEQPTMKNFNAKFAAAIAEAKAQALSAGVKVANGNYVGTNKFGESNPNILTFSFVPKLVVVAEGYQIQYPTANFVDKFYVFVAGANFASMQTLGGSSESAYCRLMWDGNKVSWYHTSDYLYQLNGNNIRYCYTAIG